MVRLEEPIRIANITDDSRNSELVTFACLLCGFYDCGTNYRQLILVTNIYGGIAFSVQVYRAIWYVEGI